MKCAIVGAFVGLVLLAVALLGAGIALVVGAEHVRTRFSPQATQAVAAAVEGPNAPHEAMRPFKVAKRQAMHEDEKLYGLLLVMGGLALLWILPGYLFKSRQIQLTPPIVCPPAPQPQFLRHGTRDSWQSSQVFLGGLTLIVLLVSFAFLKPSNQTRKADNMFGTGNRTETAASPG